ncbi:MAG: nuclear transport factor 2 family protein [Desulfobacteraceae bacterium]|nr:nuclear transport factor 2 family protein [Desulfobacteraceae bacterium]
MEQNRMTAESDLEIIKKKVLGYIEAWYAGEPERGEKSLHPDLVKRIARMDSETGKPFLEMMSASKLADRWRSGDGKKTPKELQLKDITVLDVHGNMASIKLETASWVDYMHLAKFNGEWVIVNILWEVKPVY